MMQRLAAIALCLLALTALACGSIQATGEAIDETALTTRIESRLAADPEVSAFNVKVSVENGIATLTGKVDDRDAAREAVELTGDTAGVRGVINRMEVPRDPAMVDMEITVEVTEALKRLDVTALQVQTEDAVVTLRGTVDSEERRDEILDAVREVEGVEMVRDNLTVGQS